MPHASKTSLCCTMRGGRTAFAKVLCFMTLLSSLCCGVQSLTTKHTDVVIVGGGLTGLLTAKRLQEARQEVAITVLEQGSAVGGQLKRISLGSGPLQDHMVDGGAIFVGKDQLMLRSLLQEMGIPISQLHYSYTGLNAGASCVSADAVPISTSSYNQFYPNIPSSVKTVLATLRSTALAEAQNSTAQDQTTVAQWIEANVADPFARAYVGNLTENLFGTNKLQSISLQFFLLFIRTSSNWDCLLGLSGGARDAYVPLTTYTLASRLWTSVVFPIRGVPADVMLNTPATSIAYNATTQKVMVHSAPQDTTFVASHVVIALPGADVGVQWERNFGPSPSSSLSFTPDLQTSKLSQGHSLLFAAVGRSAELEGQVVAYLTFRTAFWRQAGVKIPFGGFLYDLSSAGGLGVGVIAGVFTEGPMVGNYTQAQRQVMFTDMVHSYIGSLASYNAPIAYTEALWGSLSSDPYAHQLGGYLQPGVLSGYYSALSQGGYSSTVPAFPPPPLHDRRWIFAASDMSPFGNTMEGAVRLANRTASTLVDIFVPVIALSHTELTFAPQLVGTSSGSLSVTITNTGHGTLSFTQATIAGVNPADFTTTGLTSGVAGSCTTSTKLQFMQGCSLQAVFAPQNAGPRQAMLQVLTTDPNYSVVDVVLRANATAPGLHVTPTIHDFGNRLTVATSPAPTQTFTIHNNGSAPLSNIVVSLQGAGAAQFSLGQDSGETTLAPNAVRTVQVSFSPQAAGLASAMLAVSGSSLTAMSSLQGMGVAPGRINVSTTTLQFGAASLPTIAAGGQGPRQTVTLVNTGAGELTVSSTALQGFTSNNFAIVSGSIASATAVPPGGALGVVVEFRPTIVGPISSQLVFTSDSMGVANTQTSVTLMGNGTRPLLRLQGTSGSPAPSSLAFGNVVLASAAVSRSFAIANVGSAPLMLYSVAVGPSGNASAFAITAGAVSRTAPVSVPPNGVHAVTVSFTVAGVGMYFGDTVVVSNAPLVNTTTTLPLQARGVTTLPPTAAPTPAPTGAPTPAPTTSPTSTPSPTTAPTVGPGANAGLTLSPTSLSFGGVSVPGLQAGGAAPTMNIDLHNTGTGPLTLSGLSISGANANVFTITNSAAAGVLAAGAHRTVSLRFAPTAKGTMTASLVITSNLGGAPGHQTTVALQGKGTAPVALVVGSFDFQGVAISTSSSRRAILRNTGDAQMTVSGLVLTGMNASLFSVTVPASTPLTVDAGSETQIEIRFQPLTVGSASAQLMVHSNAPSVNSTLTVPITATSTTKDTSGSTGGGRKLSGGVVALLSVVGIIVVTGLTYLFVRKYCNDDNRDKVETPEMAYMQL